VKSRALAITGIATGIGVVAINFSILNTAFATIQKEFSASILELQWMLNIYGIFISVFLVTMGRLADTYGRRRLFLIGLAIAGLASLISGLSPAPSWIIVAQALQGIAGAILLPVSQALISHLYPDNQRSHAIGIWATIAGLLLGIGPPVGGIIIHTCGWRWIFLINIPVVIVGAFLILRHLKESKSKTNRGEIDIPGILVLTVAIGALILAIVQGPQLGWSSHWDIMLFAAFLIAAFFLILVERKARFPIIHPEFFLNRNFVFGSLANFCMIGFVWAMFFLLPLYFQTARGDSPLLTGVVLLLVTGPLVLFSTAVGKLYGKIGARLPLIIGFLLLILSVGVQFSLEKSSGIVLPMLACLTLGIGWVFIIGPSTTVAISALSKDLAGVASGGFITIQEIGGSLGLAITGTVFRIVEPPFMQGYRNAMWVLLAISILGLVASLCLKTTRRRNP